MQNRKAINWGVWGLLAICLGQALYIYISTPHSPDPDRIVSITKVGDGGAIYEVLYGSGGATVSTIYRYFLMELQPTSELAMEQIKSETPFLVTKAGGAVREVSGVNVRLQTDKIVYKFSSVAYFVKDSELNVVALNLVATMP